MMASRPSLASARLSSNKAVARSVVANVAATPEPPVASQKPATGYEYAKTLPGITEPFGEMFDPAGFTKWASAKEVKRWRESELTHGRVSMLAALGFVIGEQLEDFPAFVNFDGHISGPAIYQFQQVQQGFWEPLLIAIGLAESYRVNIGWATPTGTGFNALKDEYNPGELGFDPLGLRPANAEEYKVLQTKELNNGRLAMIAIAAFVAQELVEKTEIFEHLALRFEKELIEELDDIERDFGLPETPLPDNLKAL